jgi:hypothetical protein
MLVLRFHQLVKTKPGLSASAGSGGARAFKREALGERRFTLNGAADTGVWIDASVRPDVQALGTQYNLTLIHRICNLLVAVMFSNMEI